MVANSAERERILRLRRDPYLSALMTGEMITTHRQIRAGKVARDPAFAELYMAYALSVNGTSRFMELLRDRPSPSEAGSARRHEPRIVPVPPMSDRGSPVCSGLPGRPFTPVSP